MGRKGRSGGSRPPRPPEVAPGAPESLPAYPAVDTAAAIGVWTVGIRTPLSNGIVLTMGFGGRRRPDVVRGERLRRCILRTFVEFLEAFPVLW